MDFTKQVINWYRKHKRDLPWRQTKEPYFIWLSEIILQQTRVDQGYAYYMKFATRYPTIFHLARATEEDVLKSWQGLGYYSRARNLHTTARYIADELEGVFPDTYETLLKLKGVGDYTAAAIASFAYKLPHAVVDGNVFRVLARYFDIDTPINKHAGKKQFQKLAYELIDQQEPGLYNQAIMEFGALYCKPQKPDCVQCIFKDHCLAYARNRVSALPVKEKKAAIRNRYFDYLLIRYKESVYVRKRTKKDIWQNLYDFPLIENQQEQGRSAIVQSGAWEALFGDRSPLVESTSEPIIHKLSHQTLHARFWHIRIEEELDADMAADFVLQKSEALKELPIPRLLDEYLNRIKFI